MVAYTWQIPFNINCEMIVYTWRIIFNSKCDMVVCTWQILVNSKCKMVVYTWQILFNSKCKMVSIFFYTEQAHRTVCAGFKMKVYDMIKHLYSTFIYIYLCHMCCT